MTPVSSRTAFLEYDRTSSPGSDVLHWEQHAGEKAAEELSLHTSLTISFTKFQQSESQRWSSFKKQPAGRPLRCPQSFTPSSQTLAAVLALLSSVLLVLLLLPRPPLCLPLFPLQGSSVFRWFLISSVFPSLFWQQQSDITQMVDSAACFHLTMVFSPGPALMCVCSPSVEKQVEKMDG